QRDGVDLQGGTYAVQPLAQLLGHLALGVDDPGLHPQRGRSQQDVQVAALAGQLAVAPQAPQSESLGELLGSDQLLGGHRRHANHRARRSSGVNSSPPPFHCRSTGEKSSSLAPPPGLRPNSPVPHPLPPAFGRRYLPPSLRSGGLIPRRGRNPRGAVRKKKPPG